MGRHLRILGLGALIAFVSAAPSWADIAGEAVTYEVDGKTYEGYFARNTDIPGKQPVVLIVHDWDGLNAYEQRRAQMIAEQGFAAFAVDLYGQGIKPTTPDENRALSGALNKDRAAMRARLSKALETAKGLPGVDADRVVAIGYCFGGGAILELARTGADLKGFVSLHGSLALPEGQDYKAVKAPILVLHGSNDPAVPMTVVADLAKSLNQDDVEHRMEIYGGALHAFTVWGGSQYQAAADLASWSTLVAFLDRRLR